MRSKARRRHALSAKDSRPHFLCPETSASANTIQSNLVGIQVDSRSTARIIGNNIISNTGDGIVVLRDSQADIAANVISGNGGDGIEVGENSMLQLGEDSGSSIFESPNTSGAANSGFAFKCTTGSVMDGRRGSLAGAAGLISADASCIDSTIP